MIQRVFLLTAVILLVGNTLNALSSIDKYFLRNCESDCNGGNINCGDCINRSVQLNDERAPLSPELKFD